MDVAWLGVVDGKRVVSSMNICLALQLSVEHHHIVGETVSEFLHILFVPLPLEKLSPRPEQIFDRNDIFVGMGEDAQHPLNPAPPHFFATKIDPSRAEAQGCLWNLAAIRAALS